MPATMRPHPLRRRPVEVDPVDRLELDHARQPVVVRRVGLRVARAQPADGLHAVEVLLSVVLPEEVDRAPDLAAEDQVAEAAVGQPGAVTGRLVGLAARAADGLEDTPRTGVVLPAA